MTKKQTNNVGTTLNTEGVIKAMAEKSKSTDHQMSQTEVHSAIALLKETVIEALESGQKVQLTGFVTFTPSYRAERKGNNVITNEPMDIPACVVVSAKAGKALKDSVKDLDDKMIEAIKNA